MLYNIDPKLWGEPFWKILHIITISYPNNPTEDDKQHIKIFFENLQHILPCENCRNHYKNNLKKYPLTNDILSSRYKLIEWLVVIHNEVNRRTGKPEISIEQVIKKYTQKEKSNLPIIATIILLIFLIVILIYYYKKYQ